MRFPRSKRSRSRNLSQDIEVGESGPIEQQANISQTSPLLDLPVEIRLQILRSIFSRHIIHFFIARTEEGAQFGWPQGRVKPTKPWIQSKWCSPSCSYRFNDTDEEEVSGGRHDVQLRPSHALDVLLSCQQLYDEAIELLYAENVFDFVDLLSFGDFASQFQPVLHRIRYLYARHKVPTLGHYARVDPPAGLRAAVKVSWDGPAMLLHFAAAVMPQLRQMKLVFERCWMTSEYEAAYSRRHAEWVRYITQLAKCPGVGQPQYVRALGLPWHPQLQALDE
jgi:hypothetical protein